MDESETPVSGWLAFALAFDANARLLSHLRDQQLSCHSIGRLIQQCVETRPASIANTPLAQALGEKLAPEKLALLSSRKISQAVEQALRWESLQPDHHLLALDHPSYPELLRNTADAPALLYAKGDLASLRRPTLAIVGSRKASQQALRQTRELAAKLAERGFAIISGLAMGIDAAAHNGALEAGGVTIAVSATEPESVYPKRHRQLAQSIVNNGGLIVTEYPLGAPTLKWYFPRRNRIISGLCSGVLVAEASLPSGSLTTATHAINQGREVMAIPGSISNPGVKGCHWLIKQGAALVECEEDVLDTLGPDIREQLSTSNCRHFEPSSKNSHEQSRVHLSADIGGDDTHSLSSSVLEQLSAHPASADELMERLASTLQCTVAELNAAIGLLEINGQITASAGGRYSRC